MTLEELAEFRRRMFRHYAPLVGRRLARDMANARVRKMRQTFGDGGERS